MNCILLFCTSIQTMSVGYFSFGFLLRIRLHIYIYTTRARLYSYTRKNIAIVQSSSISIGFFTVHSSRLEFPVYRRSPVCRYCFLSDICLVFFSVLQPNRRCRPRPNRARDYVTVRVFTCSKFSRADSRCIRRPPPPPPQINPIIIAALHVVRMRARRRERD